MSSSLAGPTRVRPTTVALRVTAAVRAALICTLIGCVVATLGLADGRPSTAEIVTVAEPFDPEVVLPARVDAALHRTHQAVERAVAATDDRRWLAARRALRAASLGYPRSQRAVLRQVALVPPPDSEEESTAGPDSVLAALNVEQVAVSSLAGLFDRLRRPAMIRALQRALAAAQTNRAALITVLVGLDPEGAGAAYADALADTVPAYTDEVAGLAEVLADDVLTVQARAALEAALARSTAAEAQMTAAYGGGE